MKYTDGAWKVCKREDYPIKIRIYGYDGRASCVADVYFEDDAQLISASLDLYEACKAQHNAIDMLFALLLSKDPNFFPSKSGQPWEALIKGNKAIKKAEGI